MRVFLHAMVNGNTDQELLPALEGFCPNEVNRKFYEKVLGKPVDSASLAELALARLTAQRLASETQLKTGLVKTHHTAGLHLGMPTINLSVTAGAIYIVRNPLDVAVSLHRFLSISYEEVAEIMQAGSDYVFRVPGASYYHVGSWASNVDSWTRSQHQRLKIVRYEDMSIKPQETFAEIVNFLGFKNKVDRLPEVLSSISFSNLKDREKKQALGEHGFLQKPYFRKGQSRNWREEISPALVRKITQGSENLLERFGYLKEIEAFCTGG